MATRKKTTATKVKGTSPTRRSEANQKHRYCALRPAPQRSFGTNVSGRRLSFILASDMKWVNGTVLTYHFLKNSQWTTPEKECQVVRKAFQHWKNLGIGLEFKEVDNREDALIRISFLRNGEAWSYVGRDVRNYPADEPTMNFGWSILNDLDTVLHEIGHSLGLEHEHQNPHAGIEWDEEAVYKNLGAPPNNWSRDTTYHNIIEKIKPDTVQGSSWDPDSVMHYPFEKGLIRKPVKYQKGLQPAGGLSARDIQWIKTLYPGLAKKSYSQLELRKTHAMKINAGQQLNFTFKPTETREYSIQTFGKSDSVLVLFEDTDGEAKYLSGDDDSGEDYNASIKFKLFRGRTYIIRVRLYYSERKGETAIMIW